MSTETKPTGLVAALARIQSQMPVVHKGETATVPTKSGGQYKYSYADLSDVARTVYPLMAGVGLAFIAAPTYTNDKYVLSGELAHESGESRSAVFPLPERGTPQELGSAITYGRRYLLGCLTGIVTGDQDDDGAAASKLAAQRRSEPQRDAPATPAQVRAQIAEIGVGKGMSHEQIKDDFAGFAQGELIGEADVAMLAKYRDQLRSAS